MLTEDFIVSAHRDSIERPILDWREKAQLLKIRMPTILADVTAAYEIPYGVIERPADGAEEPGQRWIDASGTIEGVDGRLGLAVLNDGKYGFDILDGEPAEQPSEARSTPITSRPCRPRESAISSRTRAFSASPYGSSRTAATGRMAV